ncbi:unnamed protein product [Strongylus vulgaris]|uniref:Uncharacterized protein n=1 Tax=Strongylus vulgaris TaxID=40348 RepID=A0A3P7LWX2_STRVU|nr:unnamed protein product [Strongylus vulgaris]
MVFEENMDNLVKEGTLMKIIAASLRVCKDGFCASQELFLKDNQLKQQVPQSLLTSPTSSDGSSYSPSNLNPFGSSPDLLRGPLLFPPQSPAGTSSPPDTANFAANAAVAASLIAAPVAINPTSTAFPFPLVTNESLLTLLANYKLLEQNTTEISSSEPMDTQINSIIDVCNV